MERTFESQSSGYGRMVLGVIRATKAKVSGFFTAFGLPKIVVSILTWALLLSVGLMLAGLIVFAAFVYFAITSKHGSGSEYRSEECSKEADAGWLGPEMDIDHWNDPTLSWHYTKD